MRKIVLIFGFILFSASVFGQINYKVELSMKFQAIDQNAINTTIYPLGSNGGSQFPSIFDVTVNTFSEVTRTLDEIRVYSSPITHFRTIIGFSGSGPASCFNPNPPDASFPGSQCSFINFGFTDCVAINPDFSLGNKFFPLEDFAGLNPGSGDINDCGGKNITVSSLCGFKYRLFAVYQGAEIDILTYGDNSRVIKVKRAGNLTQIPYGQPFSLQVEYVDNPTSANGTSTLLTGQRFLPCPPELDATVSPNPDPIAPACVGDSDGGFDVTFNRVLRADEKMSISVHPGTMDPSIIDAKQNLVASDFSGRTYRFLGTNLAAGSYRMSYIVGPIVPDAFPAVAGTDGFFTITDPPPVTFIQTTNDASCTGTADGDIVLTAQGGTGPYQYLLTPIGGSETTYSTSTIPTLAEGDYSLRVRDNNNCLSDPQNISIQSTSSTPVLNTGTTITNQLDEAPLGQASITLGNISGGTGSFTYVWTRSPDNGFGTVTARDLTALTEGGVYSLIITSATCVSQTYPFTINDIQPLAVNFSTIGEANCEGDTATIRAQGQGGTGGYTYLWSNGATTDAISVGPGTYTVTVTDGSGTSTNDSFTLNYINSNDGSIITEVLSVSLTSTTNVLCQGDNTGAIDLSISGGTGTYEVFWDGSFTATSEDRTALPVGDYYYSVSDGNCVVTNFSNQITITEPPVAFQVSATSTDATTNGGNEGTITLIITDGGGNYTFAWTETNSNTVFTPNIAANANEFTGFPSGTYQVIVTDLNNNGCTATLPTPIFIDQPGPLGITSLTPAPVLCRGEATGSITAVVTGVAPFNYIWERQDGQPITSPNTPTIANLAEGIYILRLTDASGNPEVTDTVTITEPLEALDATAAPTAVTCFDGNDGSIQITALGGTAPYEYEIDDGFGFQDSDTFTNLASRIYAVTVRDANNCVFNTTTIVDQPIEITVTTDNLINASVSGGMDGAIFITVNGGTAPFTFSWAGPNGYVNNIEDIAGLGVGSYTLVIRDANNGGFINGCYFTQTFVISEPGPLSINNITPTDVSCYGEASGSINTMVTGEGTIVYEWTFADGSPILISNGTDGPDITGIDTGSYRLTVTDDNTTTSSPPITINQPNTSLNITNIFTTDVSCFGGNDGSIQIEAQGGTGAYTYSLDGINYQNSAFFNGLAQGSITAFVKDGNNCDFISPDPVTINEPQELSFVIDIQQPLSASNAADGAITITASGGTGGLSYNWTGPTGFTPINSNVLENLPGGDYLVTITDENYALNNGSGCILVSQQPITISEPGQLIVSLNQTVSLECNGDDFAEITANVQGGVVPYTFEWFRTENGNAIQLSEDTEIIGNLTAGTYFVRVTDTNTITVDATSIIIDQPDLLEITEDSITDVLCSGTETGSIAISVQGGTLPYTYEWSNGAVTEDLTNIAAGEYSVLIFDENGCLADSTFIVGTPDDALHIFNATLVDVSEYQANDGSIALEISGGSQPYTIAWTRISDGQNVGDQTVLSNLAADTYEVLITDTNGCTVTEIYEVVQPDVVEETIMQPTCAGESNGSIEVLVNQGNGVFTYSWSTGETTSGINGLGGGTYSVTITGFGDGPIIRSYIILDPLPLEVDLGEDRTLCAGQELKLEATVENANATYIWTSDNGFSSSESNVTINENGNYSVVVSTQNGCTATGSIFVDITDDEINAEFAVSSQVFVGESLIAVDISYPLPETQEWILPEGATILKQDSDEAAIVFNTPGEYEIGIMTRIGECFAQQTKKVLVTENEVLTSADGQADPRKLIEDFLIYPNPTDGKFTADIVLSERGNISIKIFNFANNALMASKKDRGASSYSLPFDISGLPSGVYAVLLETPFGNSLRKIILK